VLRDGEEIVCLQIFAICFQSDDALKTWYLGMPSVIRTIMTTKPGCWNLFRKFLLMRFLIGDSPRLRRLAAEEVRELRPGVPCATFAIWKIYYMQCADPHLAPGAAIAMVKRELGWDGRLWRSVVSAMTLTTSFPSSPNLTSNSWNSKHNLAAANSLRSWSSKDTPLIAVMTSS
jgi:hypothetical protein